MTISKENVQEKLSSLANIPMKDRPKDKEGNLDLKAFNEMKEVKQCVKSLKEMGIDKKWPMENGFMIASMILTFEN